MALWSARALAPRLILSGIVTPLLSQNPPAFPLNVLAVGIVFEWAFEPFLDRLLQFGLFPCPERLALFHQPQAVAQHFADAGIAAGGDEFLGKGFVVVTDGIAGWHGSYSECINL